jgi:hypothetical protein
MAKDTPLIDVKSTREEVSKKGRDMRTFTFEPEAIQLLIQTLQQEAAGGKRVKLTFHTGDKQTEDGRSFRSSFLFVNEVQPFGSNPQGGSGPKRSEFKPKQKNQMSEGTRAAAARTLNTQVE